MLDPVFDALGMEEVLLMTIKSSDKLFVLKVLPANNALFLTMIKASAELKLAHASEHRYLVIKVLESIDIHEQVVLDDIFEDKQPINDD